MGVSKEMRNDINNIIRYFYEDGGLWRLDCLFGLIFIVA